MSFITDALGITGQDEPDYSKMEFQPYSISGPTGGVNWDGKSGTVTLSPELQNLYAKYTGAATAALPSEEQTQFATDIASYGKGLFTQGINLDTQGMTSDYYNRVLAGLQPQREQENVSLANTLFSQGRTGAGAGVEGGYVNPEQFALLKAREQTNAGIYLSAEERARAIQADTLSKALGYYGMGEELKYKPYERAASLMGTGINLANVNTPYLGYGLQAGTGASQAGANIVNAQQQYADSQMGFWGDLIGGASTVFGGASKPWFMN